MMLKIMLSILLAVIFPCTNFASALTKTTSNEKAINISTPFVTFLPFIALSTSLTPGNILFSDNFDNGLSPAWKVIPESEVPYTYNLIINYSGEVVFMPGGKITSVCDWGWGCLALLQIGDETWKNYQIEYDLAINPDVGQGQPEIDLMLRLIDLTYGVKLTNENAYVAWWKKTLPNRWGTEIPGTAFYFTTNALHMIVTVKGDRYQFKYELSEQPGVITKQPDVLIPGFSSGGVVIGVPSSSNIDNFKVTRLP